MSRSVAKWSPAPRKLGFFERLLEDLHDLAVVAERKRESPVELAEIKRRLKRRASL